MKLKFRDILLYLDASKKRRAAIKWEKEVRPMMPNAKHNQRPTIVIFKKYNQYKKYIFSPFKKYR